MVAGLESTIPTLWLSPFIPSSAGAMGAVEVEVVAEAAVEVEEVRRAVDEAAITRIPTEPKASVRI